MLPITTVITRVIHSRTGAGAPALPNFPAEDPNGGRRRAGSWRLAPVLLCLFLLAAEFATVPVAAANQAPSNGITGAGTYESPSYGYAVRWVDLWMPVDELTNSNGTLDVLTFDLMVLPARAQIFGLPPGGTPADALNVAVGAVQKQFPDVKVVDESGGRTPTAVLEYVYGGVPAHHLFEARELASGNAVVVVALLAPADQFEDRLQNAQVGIRIDGKPLFASVSSRETDNPTPTPKPSAPDLPKPIHPKTTPPAGQDGLRSLLPSVDEVPEGLVLEDDVERTLDQMTYQLGAAFNSEAEAAQQLAQWGWQGTVDRQFSPADGDALDNGIERLWVVIYQFDGAGSAEEALAAFVKAIRAEGAAKGVRVAAIGDESVGLMDGSHVVDVFNLWTRANGYVIWVGGTTSGAFPRDVVEDLAEKVVAKVDAGVAGVDTRVTPETGGGRSTAAYESPRYGYRLTYDPAVWKISQEDQTPDDDFDQVLLSNGNSFVYLIGDPDYHGDAMAGCVADYQRGLEKQDEVSRLRGVRGGSGEEVDRAWTTVSYQFTGSDDKTSSLVRYIECRAMGGGVTLVVMHTSLDETYDGEIQAREDLLAGLEPAANLG